MFPFRLFFAMFFVAFATLASFAQGAEFERRPDLQSYLAGLQPIYRPTNIVDLPENRSETALREGGRDDLARLHGMNHEVISLSGKIEKGDLERLEAFLDQIRSEGRGFFTWQLVLESRGGDFQEGINIGMWLRESLSSQDPNFFGSYVLKDSECLSACALIFALSSHRRMLDDTDSANYIELGGRLGFHMGIIPDALSKARAPIRDVMNLTYDIMAAYMVLIEDQTSPPELITEALKARDSESFFYVEASPKAYDLGFIPVSKTPLSEPLSIHALSMERLQSLCMHLRDISQLPRTIVNEDYGFMHGADVTMVRDLFSGRPDEVLRGHFVSGESCLVGLSPNGNLMIDVTTQEILCRDENDLFANWCVIDQEETYEHQLYSFGTNALLADISGCSMGKLDARIDPAGTELDPYAYPESIGAIEVEQVVKLRAAPTSSADVLGELPVGTRMRLRDCAVTTDNQAIWLKVDPDGQSGWISARSVRF